ncbi:Condensin-2 complex subunit H2 [Aphelenchoides besseyi]|nr:Condensin-2 complex subunit H2 [Aphelenchoides besseyi]KAI6207492.1 Condensin-2 complex subunit H2 [Aphelenchoides besseyi]
MPELQENRLEGISFFALKTLVVNHTRMGDTQEQHRYLHLLQPIRDVETNWDGNIKEHLNEYLNKLKNDRERQVIDDEGDSVRFNFSEAAMLLQGSLYIYAKKVDNLHAAISDVFAHGIGKGKKKKVQIDQADVSEERTPNAMTGKEYVLLDEKEKMMKNLIDTAWLIEQDQKKEKKAPAKVGNKRVDGNRDTLVKLPISFIPTKKCVLSAHHLRFKQNDEFVYINQNDLFCTNMTVFINPAYFGLKNFFTPEYIPYLRDSENKRCAAIGNPYNIVAPQEAYERLCSYDQHENRPEDSFVLNYVASQRRQTLIDFAHDDFGDEYGAVDHEMEDCAPNYDFTNHLPSLVEVDRASQGLPDPIICITQRESGLPVSSMDIRRSTANFHIPMSIGPSIRNASVESLLNVENELMLIDEYSTPQSIRLRSKTTGRTRIKKTHCRSAEKQVQTRNEMIKKRMIEAGKEYEKETANTSNYIAAKLFSRRICKIGAIIDNFNPTLRDRKMQILNRPYYHQELYEKSVMKKRREEQEERRRREEAQKRRNERLERASARSSARPEEPREKRPRRSDSPSFTQENDFGVPVDEVEEYATAVEMSSHSDYDPANLLEREVNAETDANHEDDFYDDPMSDVEIFPDQSDEHVEEDIVRGDVADNVSATFLFGVDTEETRSLSKFVSNDRQFFEFTELEKFFKRVNLDTLTSDRAFIQQLQSFWNSDNETSKEGVKKRLQNWTKHIVQRIEEDTNHNAFEIHNYGGAILRAFGPGTSGIGKTIKFKDIVEKVPRYEASRYLLAVLILANCGNIEIINDDSIKGDGRTIMYETKIKLISLEEHRRVFESEQALISKT